MHRLGFSDQGYASTLPLTVMNTLASCVFASPRFCGYDFYLSFVEISAGDHVALDERLRGSASLPRMPDTIPIPGPAILPRTLFQPHTPRQSRQVC